MAVHTVLVFLVDVRLHLHPDLLSVVVADIAAAWYQQHGGVELLVVQ